MCACVRACFNALVHVCACVCESVFVRVYVCPCMRVSPTTIHLI